jgi:hypothetical protein
MSLPFFGVRAIFIKCAQFCYKFLNHYTSLLTQLVLEFINSDCFIAVRTFRQNPSLNIQFRCQILEACGQRSNFCDRVSKRVNTASI